MDCVENCGYNNLSLSRIVARVFSLKSTLQHLWVMWIYIVWLGTGCVRYDKLTKQNVSQVSHRKALPVRHLRKPAITICHDSSHSSHMLITCFTLQEASCKLPAKSSLLCTFPWVFTLSLTHTTLTNKSHIKYRVHKIAQNYNQIWHGIKANIK